MAIVDKRVVLRTLTGQWAGKREIQGTVSQLYRDIGVKKLPMQVEDVDFGDHRGPAKLMYQMNHYVLYAEVVPPTPMEPSNAPVL